VTRLTLPMSAVIAFVLVGCSGSPKPETGEDPPVVVDSDGDGLNDDEDRIYTGYWPYNPNKDMINDPGLAGNVSEVGGTLPRIQWPDQYGDVVDIYDFAGQGKLTVVDLSGQWCYWCHELADWLEYVESDYDQFGYDAYEPIRAALASGELQWITIIDGNAIGSGPATENTINAWFTQHPFEHIPVLLDDDFEFLPWISHGEGWFYPSYVVVDENMEVLLMPTIQDFGDHIFPALTEMLEPQ
jgi:hypothetical protein